MRYEDGSSNTTTANTWRVITQQRHFIARIWPRTFGRISRCSGKNCKNSCHTLTLADSQSCTLLQEHGSWTRQATARAAMLSMPPPKPETSYLTAHVQGIRLDHTIFAWEESPLS